MNAGAMWSDNIRNWKRSTAVKMGPVWWELCVLVLFLTFGMIGAVFAQGFVPIEGLTRVAAGGDHTCALTSAGGVKCWGANGFGQLGDNTTTQRLTPVDVFGLSSGVTAIAAGRDYTCALTSAGGVKCWGYNEFGQLGDESTTNRMTPVDVSGLSSGVTKIEAGYGHTCALTSAGGAKCWGANVYGQLGDNSTTQRLIPVAVSGLSSGVTAIAAGNFHTCALTGAGGVKCWGRNEYGQLGNNSTTQSLMPVDVTGLISGVTAIAAGSENYTVINNIGFSFFYGSDHTCALTSAGGVKCWGRNEYGQLGDDTTMERLVPVDVIGLISGVTSIAAGAEHSCALTSAGGVKCWGRNDLGQLGDDSTMQRLTPVEVSGLLSGVTAIAVGEIHTCALTGAGRVKCWGGNRNGQLGDNATGERLIPTNVSGLSSGVTAIAAGFRYTCALTSTGGVKCWGANGSGQLGNNSTMQSLLPVNVSGLSSGRTAIAAGGSHTCAGTSAGALKCWGNNEFGQLGDNSTVQQLTPVDVSNIFDMRAIAAGDGHTCVRGLVTGAKCWGYNAFGQLGDNSTTNRLIPVGVSNLGSGVTLTAITTGGNHSCALTNAGVVKCWGANSNGQLGNNTATVGELVPVDVSGLSGQIGVAAIAAGYSHTCALTSIGGVKCWGRNDYGQLGDNTTTQRLMPVDVSGLSSGVMAIAAAGGAVFVIPTTRFGGHTCALTSAGAVKCWGRNDYGQLGDNTTTGRQMPVDVSGLNSGVMAISVGYDHSCALTSAGGVKCWGSNSNGQLGDGTGNIRPFPASVLVPALSSAALSASPNPSVYARPLTLTATAAFNGDGASGSVVFRSDGAIIPNCGSVLLLVAARTGTAQCVISSLSAGSHQLTAEYLGDGFFAGSTSSALTQTVSPPPIALTPLPPAAVRPFVGVTYSQTIVASGVGTTAPFRFLITGGGLPNDLNLLETGVLSGTPSLTGVFTFTATATDSSSPDVGGPFSGTQEYTIEVLRQATTSAVTSDLSPSIVNRTLSFTASVATHGFPLTAGTVQFFDGAVLIPGCGSVLLTGGGNVRTANCLTAALATGAHSITTSYSGDAFNLGATSAAFSQTITAPTFTFTPAGPSLPGGQFNTSGYQAGPIAVSTAAVTGVLSPVSYQVLPSASALPPGLNPSVSGGLLLSGTPTAAGSYNFTIRATDNSAVAVNGPFSAEQSYTIVIDQRTQTINFAALPDRPLASGAFTVSASATSALPVSFSSVTTGTCTVTGVTVTPVAFGTCTVRATQLGDSNWIAAPAVDRSFNVLPNSTLLLSTSASQSIVNTTVTLTATLSGFGPTGTVEFRDGGTPLAACSAQPLSGTGDTRTAQCATALLPQGIRNLTAVYPGDGGNNTAATSNTVTQTVSSPTFTFSPAGPTLPSGQFNTAGYQAGPISVSTAAVTGVLAPVSYQVLPSVAALPPGLTPSVSGGLLISGTPTAAGTYNFSIRATDNSAIAVNGPFSAEQSYTIVIDQRTQTITFAALPDRPLASGAFTVSATANSSLPVMFSSQTTGTCTVAGNTVTPVAAGTCTVRASQSGDSNWIAAAAVDRSFNVLATSTLVMATSGSPSTVNTQVTLTATLSGLGPTGTVEFRDGGTPIAACAAQPLTGTGNTRTAQCATALLPQGIRNLTAFYAGDGNNTGATSNAVTQNVQRPTFTFTPSGNTLPTASVGSTYTVTFAASGAGTVAPLQYFADAPLPAGLNLNPTTGVLSGTPTEGGPSTVSVVAQDSSLKAVGGPFTSTARNYTLAINVQTTVTLGTITPSPCVIGQACTVAVTVSSADGVPGGSVNVSVSDGGGSCVVTLSAGAGSCGFAPSGIAGTRTVTAVYAGQSPYLTSNTSTTHGFVPSDVAPQPSYNPGNGSPINLTGTGTFLGDAATGSVTITATGGSGNGNVTLGCSVGSQTGGNFTLQSAPSVLINPGSTPSPIAVRCTRTAAIQSGTLSCTETSSPGTTQLRSWPLACPAAAAVPPALSYVPAPDPAPNSAVVFPGGNSGAVVSATIEVTNTPAIGVGSTALSCLLGGPQAGGFQVTGGNNQTVSATQGAVNLQLSCTLGNSPRTATLNCTETDSPVVATRTRTWPLSCPAGLVAAAGVVTVGRKVGVREQRLVVPIGFVTDGETYSVSAQVSFETARLSVVNVRGVLGAMCFQLPAPNQNRIQMQRSLTTLPLPTDERYCDVTFQVADNALGGVSPLTVVASTCTDIGGNARLCTEQDGQIAIAALDPTPADGTTLVIAGHVGTAQQSQTLRVVNRGAGDRQISSCTIEPATGLQITAPTSFPVTLIQGATQMVTVMCTLPPLGEQRLATLTCSTNDPMRTVMQYPISCRTYPAGAALPTQQLLDLEQREGEQMGTSVARSSTPAGSVTALGAPLGGTDGQGRVLLFEDSPGSGTQASGSEKRGVLLRAIASLQLQSFEKGTPSVSKQLGKAVALRADGGQVAVGAPFDGQGKVLLFDRPAGGWSAFDSRTATPVTLEAPTLAGGTTEEFGAALAYTANGDLVVGAPGSSVGGVSGAGAAFVYARNSSGFDPPASVTSSSLAVSNGRFGASLAVRSDQIVVGATGELTTYPMPPPQPPLVVRTGAAYRIGTQGGALSAPIRITPTTALSANDQFGSAIALTQNTLIIGVAGDDTAEGVDSGSAILFKPGASASGWNEASQLLPAMGSLGGQEMGASIAVNGDLIFVGAPKADVSAMEDRGRVYVYPVKASYSAQERPTSVLDNEGGRSRDEFGRALVINGSAAVIGVPKADLVLVEGSPIPDVGRGDAFLLEELFGDGFE